MITIAERIDSVLEKALNETKPQNCKMIQRKDQIEILDTVGKKGSVKNFTAASTV